MRIARLAPLKGLRRDARRAGIGALPIHAGLVSQAPPPAVGIIGEGAYTDGGSLLAAGAWAVVLPGVAGQVIWVVSGAGPHTAPRAELHAAVWVAEKVAGEVPLVIGCWYKSAPGLRQGLWRQQGLRR